MWGICITDSDVEVGGGNSFNDPVVVVILRWYVKIM